MNNLTPQDLYRFRKTYEQVVSAFDSFAVSLAIIGEKIADLEIIKMYSQKNVDKLRKRKRYERMMERRKR